MVKIWMLLLAGLLCLFIEITLGHTDVLSDEKDESSEIKENAINKIISGRRIDGKNLIEKRIGRVIGKGKRSDESLEIDELADRLQKYKRNKISEMNRNDRLGEKKKGSSPRKWSIHNLKYHIGKRSDESRESDHMYALIQENKRLSPRTWWFQDRLG